VSGLQTTPIANARVPGLRFPLRTGRSRINGQGVFANVPIPPRVKIGDVTGNLIPRAQARAIARASHKIYLVDVSKTQTLDCSRGNALRFLNHSCQPNAFLRIAHCRVEVYALHPINAGEEITADYGETPHLGGMRCTCAQPRCRTRI
jgi:SET domain-containing protein